MRRNFSKDFFIRGAYTFAKSMDESSNTGGSIKYGFPTAQDSNNLHAEWGRSDFDVRHAFTGSAIWTPTRKGPWLVRDWQLAARQDGSRRPLSMAAWSPVPVRVPAGVVSVVQDAAGGIQVNRPPKRWSAGGAVNAQHGQWRGRVRKRPAGIKPGRRSSEVIA